MKKIIISTIVFATLFLSASPALAHVSVRPKEVGVAAFQTFTIGVPVEKDIPTTELRLVIPDGLNYVTPNVKPGWTIDVTKQGEGEEAKVTEITWTGGTIPAGQRDEFFFSAQVPSTEATIAWKAYQTYEDGTVVSWDQDPKSGHSDEESDKGPYSETAVVNDLATSETPAQAETKSATSQVPVVLSIGAIILAGASIVMQLRRKK